MKKKKLLMSLVALTAVTGVASLTACTDEETPPVVEEQTYTVTFNSNGGSAVSALTTNADGKITAPTNPTKDGNTFAGWYTSAQLTGDPVNLATHTFTADTTLYAKWTAVQAEDPESYTLTMVLYAGATNQTQTVEQDDDGYYTPTKPVNPTRPYHDFEGWYSDEACTQAFNWSSSLTADTTIYANWTAQTEEVTYEFDYATALAANGDGVKLAEDYTLGKFTFGAGAYFQSDANRGPSVNNQKYDVSFSIEFSGEVTFRWRGATDSLKLYKKSGVEGTEDTVAKDFGAQTADMTDTLTTGVLTTGEYYLKSTSSCRIYELKLIETVTKSAPAGIAVSTAGMTTKYLVGRDISLSGLAVYLNFENGRQDYINAADLTVDTGSYDKTKAGTYEVSIAYQYEGETYDTSYEVHVYEIDSVTLYDYVMNSSRVTLPLQKVFLKDSAFNSNNLAVHATGKCEGQDDETFILTADEFTISTPVLTALGSQTVTVTANEKTASYAINVVDKVFNKDSATATITVNASAEAISVTADAVTFKTINDALKYLELCEVSDSCIKTINVAAGTYTEKVEVNMPNVRMIGTGENASAATITFGGLNGLLDPSGTTTMSTDGSASISIRKAATNFYAENITFANIYNTHELYEESKAIAGSGTQAVAALVQGDQAHFKNVRFSSYHDTLYAQVGRQYYENCYIEGRTDYIFGYNATAYFDTCTIKSLGAGLTEKNGGYVVATKGHSSGADKDKVTYGYIFDGCDFLGDENVQDGSVSLARGWDTSMVMMVMNSTISKAFSKEAYGNTESPLNDRYTKMNAAPVAAQLLEYNNTGDGAIAESIADTCTVVTSEVAVPYADLKTVFGVSNGLVTWSEAWAGNIVKNATVVLKDAEGNVLQTLTNVSYTESVVTEAQLKANYIVPAGYKLLGFYSDATLTTEYDFDTQLHESNDIYVKLEKTGNETILKFDGKVSEPAYDTDVWTSKTTESNCELANEAGLTHDKDAPGYDANKMVKVVKYKEVTDKTQINDYISAKISTSGIKSVTANIIAGSTATGNKLTITVEALDKDGNVVGSTVAYLVKKKVTGYVTTEEDGTDKNIVVTSTTNDIALVRFYLNDDDSGNRNWGVLSAQLSYEEESKEVVFKVDDLTDVTFEKQQIISNDVLTLSCPSAEQKKSEVKLPFSPAIASDDSGLTFTKGLLPTGTTSATAIPYSIVAKENITLVIYFTIGDSSFTTKETEKSGDIVVLRGATPETKTIEGKKKNNVAYAVTITLTKDEEIKLYSSESRLVLFGLVATPTKA